MKIIRKSILVLVVALIFFSTLFIFFVSTQPTKDGKIELRTINDNPNFDGILLMNKENYALTFRLQAKDGKILWEKPARSEWILIPSNKDIIIIFGKEHFEDYFSMEKVRFEGFSIYDKNGNLIKTADTEKIREGKLLSDGNLVLLSYYDLRVMDSSSGNELWKVPTDAETFTTASNFIIAIEPKSSPLGWESQVYDNKGNVLGNFSGDGSYWDMKISTDDMQLKIQFDENNYVFNLPEG